MSERVTPGPVQDSCGIREAVCIHTKKIFDSCRDKDCLEDLRVYPTRASQAILDRAVSVRSGRAELLCTAVDTEAATYNRGFYNVDIRYYYRITAEASLGNARPAELCGLAVFDKRVLLFGGESGAKSFSSKGRLEDGCCVCGQASLPEAVVEAVDPIVLGLRLLDPCDCGPCLCPPPPCGPACPPPCGPACPPPPCGPACPPPPCGPMEGELMEIPACVSDCFDCELSFDSSCRRLYVTLGQFSIVRLERDAQLLIPMYDYCMPTRECSASEEEREDDPCEIFRQIRFPVGEFFPSSTLPDMEPGASSGCRSC